MKVNQVECRFLTRQRIFQSGICAVDEGFKDVDAFATRQAFGLSQTPQGAKDEPCMKEINLRSNAQCKDSSFKFREQSQKKCGERS